MLPPSLSPTCSVNSTQLGSCGCGESADLRPRYGPRSPRALAARAASSSSVAVVEVEDMSRVETVDSGGEVSTAADNKVSGGPGRGPCWPSLARRSTDNNNNANYTLIIIITPPHSSATFIKQNTKWKQTNANDCPVG